MYLPFSQECTVTLTNIGKDVVERVDISLNSKLQKGMCNFSSNINLYLLLYVLHHHNICIYYIIDKESAFFTWSKENLNTQLPIAVGSSASFTLYINAVGDFVNLLRAKTGMQLIFFL